MKSININKSLFILVLCFITILFCGIQSSEAASDQIVLTYAGNMPINHFITKSQEFFAKQVEAKTGGKVKIQVYPAGQLLADKDMAKAIMAGGVDIAQVTVGQWSGIVPSWMFVDLPGTYKNSNIYQKILDGEGGKILKEEFENKTGLKHLFWMDDAPAAIALKMPVKTIEDFKGKRIRTPALLVEKMVQALGGAPSFMGGGEQYLALQRGTIDGTVTNLSSIYERKLYEVTKYVWNPGILRGALAAMINKKKWDSLPANVQKAMIEAGEEARQFVRVECQKEMDLTEGRLKEQGMEIYYLSENERVRVKQAMQPVYDYFIANGGDKAKVLLEMAEKTK